MMVSTQRGVVTSWSKSTPAFNTKIFKSTGDFACAKLVNSNSMTSDEGATQASYNGARCGSRPCRPRNQTSLVPPFIKTGGFKVSAAAWVAAGVGLPDALGTGTRAEVLSGCTAAQMFMPKHLLFSVCRCRSSAQGICPRTAFHAGHCGCLTALAAGVEMETACCRCI